MEKKLSENILQALENIEELAETAKQNSLDMKNEQDLALVLRKGIERAIVFDHLQGKLAAIEEIIKGIAIDAFTIATLVRMRNLVDYYNANYR